MSPILNVPDPQHGGYQWDSDTALNLVRHRIYHPALGSWISRDPFQWSSSTVARIAIIPRISRKDHYPNELLWFFQHIASPPQNLIQYCHGNPINYADPFGLVTPQECRRILQQRIENCGRALRACLARAQNEAQERVCEANASVCTNAAREAFRECMRDALRPPDPPIIPVPVPEENRARANDPQPRGWDWGTATVGGVVVVLAVGAFILFPPSAPLDLAVGGTGVLLIMSAAPPNEPQLACACQGGAQVRAT
jgi:hypothetical protein